MLSSPQVPIESEEFFLDSNEKTDISRVHISPLTSGDVSLLEFYFPLSS